MTKCSLERGSPRLSVHSHGPISVSCSFQLCSVLIKTPGSCVTLYCPHLSELCNSVLALHQHTQAVVSVCVFVHAATIFASSFPVALCIKLVVLVLSNKLQLSPLQPLLISYIIRPCLFAWVKRKQNPGFLPAPVWWIFPDSFLHC